MVMIVISAHWPLQDAPDSNFLEVLDPERYVHDPKFMVLGLLPLFMMYVWSHRSGKRRTKSFLSMVRQIRAYIVHLSSFWRRLVRQSLAQNMCMTIDNCINSEEMEWEKAFPDYHFIACVQWGTQWDSLELRYPVTSISLQRGLFTACSAHIMHPSFTVNQSV